MNLIKIIKDNLIYKNDPKHENLLNDNINILIINLISKNY